MRVKHPLQRWVRHYALCLIESVTAVKALEVIKNVLINSLSSY